MISGAAKWFLGTRLGRLSVGLLSAFLLLWATYVAGKRDARSTARSEALRAYSETKDRIHEVQPSPDRDAALDRLRDNGVIR